MYIWAKLSSLESVCREAMVSEYFSTREGFGFWNKIESEERSWSFGRAQLVSGAPATFQLYTEQASDTEGCLLPACHRDCCWWRTRGGWRNGYCRKEKLLCHLIPWHIYHYQGIGDCSWWGRLHTAKECQCIYSWHLWRWTIQSPVESQRLMLTLCLLDHSWRPFPGMACMLLPELRRRETKTPCAPPPHTWTS